MFKHILVPTDGSPLSESAARSAIQFAKSISARATAITVSIPFHVFSTDAVMVTDTEGIYQEDCNKRAAKYLDAVGKLAKAAGVPFEGMHMFHEQPHVAIIEVHARRVAMSSAWLRTGGKDCRPSSWGAKPSRS